LGGVVKYNNLIIKLLAVEKLISAKIAKKDCIFFEKKLATEKTYCLYLHRRNAEVAQLVELQPSKLVVASSSLVFRSKNKTSSESLRFFYSKTFQK
jgi:hypothetical protein